MLMVTSRLREVPRVVGESSSDVGLVGRIDDQQDADAPVFAAGEWPGEEHEALVCEGVHECCVVVDGWLLEGAFSVCPARARLRG